MTAYAAILLALIATGIAVVLYFKAYQAAQPSPSSEKTADLFYKAAAVALVLASGYLLSLLLTDNFGYEYVFSYSARNQAFAYKISAFWAGQEGSFLLWSLFHAGFGLMLARKKAPAAMLAYSALQFLLLVVLVVKNPFRPMPGIQPDGMGLNPLLQDPWMVIHPPIVFLGYAALAVPFAWAIHGLLTGRHKEVITQALPWTLFAWSSLGAGIFIGGYWAYKVLGWGGYWAWDPVENSSLVPWLVTGALLHLLLLARVRDVAAKYAYLSAIINFVLVLYGTYLTRSGVLNNFSTHSFGDEGVGGILGNVLFITAVGGLAVLVRCWPKLPTGNLFLHFKSREFCLCITAILLAGISILIFAGMSTPLITSFAGNPASLGQSFYNTACLPLVAAMVLLLSQGSLLRWSENPGYFIRKYWWLLLIAIAAIIPALTLGIRSPFALFTAGAALAAIVSTVIAVHTKVLSYPAGLTHIGFSVALIGIVFSSMATHSVVTSFEPDVRQEIFGKGITYLGKQTDTYGNGFYYQFILDDPPGTQLLPHTKQHQDGSPAVYEPGIYRGLTSDIYLAPVVSESNEELNEIALTSIAIKDGLAGITVRTLASLSKPQKLDAEISRKPLMSLVWLGTILVTIGTAWAALQRSRCTVHNDSPSATIQNSIPTRKG